MTPELIEVANIPLAMIFALVAGILSFASPCVLPIVPPYLAYMSGVSMAEMSEPAASRTRVLRTAFFFVMGLSTIFILLGLGASVMGRALLQWRGEMSVGAALIIMVFGAHFLGIFRIGFLDQEARVNAGDRGGSAFGAYILGLAFAFGWTPCLGPALGAILSLAAGSASTFRGAIYLACYAIGLGVPFLLVAGFFPRLKGAMDWTKRHLERIERISGLMLWTIGFMMLTGQFSVMSYWLLENLPWLASIG